MINRLLSVKTVKDLVIAILVFILVPFAFGIVSALLGWIPFVGWFIRIVGYLLDLLCLVGLILSIVGFVKNNA